MSLLLLWCACDVVENMPPAQFYHLLTLVCQDGMAVAIQTMEKLIMERYHRLLETPRKQVQMIILLVLYSGTSL